ncbi:MAG: hypothetical protein D3908_08030, partial [Candidatus Electrothrix sp. AUS4]|nr:hypothetical protein [Candidatus Electrothrix sp. AUS4]
MNDWRPDWKSSDNYLDTSSCSGSELCWEFFRRNGSYQTDYDNYISRLEEMGYEEAWYVVNPHARKVPKQDTEAERRNAWEIMEKAMQLEEEIFKKYSVARSGGDLPDPSLSYRDTRVTFPVLQQYSPYIYMFRGGGSFRRVFSMNKRPEPLFSTRGLDQESCINDEKKERKITISARRLYVSIDLMGKIDQQIDIIKYIAKAQHERLKEWGVTEKLPEIRRGTIYTEYLQILDAVAAGVTYPEIASILLPNEPNEYP